MISKHFFNLICAQNLTPNCNKSKIDWLSMVDLRFIESSEYYYDLIMIRGVSSNSNYSDWSLVRQCTSATGCAQEVHAEKAAGKRERGNERAHFTFQFLITCCCWRGERNKTAQWDSQLWQQQQSLPSFFSPPLSAAHSPCEPPSSEHHHHPPETWILASTFYLPSFFPK